jgi:hypothetical protein
MRLGGVRSVGSGRRVDRFGQASVRGDRRVAPLSSVVSSVVSSVDRRAVNGRSGRRVGGA